MTRRARKRLALVLVAGAVTVIAGIGAYTLRQAQKQRLIARNLEQGMAAYKANDYEAAIDPLYYYYKTSGADPDALYAFADSRRRVPAENDSHLGGAMTVARLAVERAENKLPALELLLELYGLTGYLTERLDTSARILALDPKHAGAMTARVESLFLLGRADQALEAAQAMAAALPDNFDAHRSVVGLLQLLKHPQPEILAYAAEVASKYPQSPRALALHADVMLSTGDTAAATELVRTAATLKAAGAAGVSELLNLFDKLGMEAEANEFLTRQLRDADAGVEIPILAAERAWKSGSAADARRYIAPAVASGDDDALGWSAFLDAQNADAPGEAFQTLASRNSPAATFWTELITGSRSMQAGDSVKAREHLRNALAARPKDELAEYLLGRVDESVGDWPLAVSRWESVVRRDPGYRIARLSLVSTLLRYGRVEDARDHARSALSARSGLMEVYGVSRAFVAAVETGRASPGDYERVVSVLESMRGQSATDPVVLPLLARAYLAAGQTDRAEEAVRALLAANLTPATEDLVPLVTALRRTSPQLAESLLEGARAAAPSDTDLIFLQAMAAAQSGRTDEGRRALEQAVETAQGDARTAAELQLMIFLDRTGDPTARDRFAAFAAGTPKNARVQLALLESQSAWSDNNTVAGAIGRLRAVAGDASPIWKLYEARRLLLFDRTDQQAAKIVQLLADVLRADPDSPSGMTLMADAMLLLGDRAKAIDFLSRVIDTQTVPALYPTLVGLLRESGRTDDVRRRLRDFLRLDGLSPELRRTRAQLLAANGMLDEAVREFETLAAEGNPEDELALARVFMRRGELARAKSILDRLLAAPDPAVAAFVTAADLAAVQGDVDAGVAILERLPASLSAAEAAMHRGAFLDRYGRSADAERVYQQAATGGSAEAAAALVSYYITSGRYEDAAEAVASGLAAHPKNPDLLRLQSVTRVARGEKLPSGAVAEVAALVLTEGDERTRERFLDLMRMWEASPSELQAHIARLRRFTESSPTFYPAWLALVGALLETGSTVDAVQQARIAARVIPNDPRAARLAVAALSRAGEIGGALDMARQWRDRIVGSTLEADCMIADLCSRLGEKVEAAAAIEPWRDRIIAEAASRPERLELYARVAAAAGKPDQAHTALWPLAQNDPEFARMYLRVAQDAGAARPEWITRAEPIVAASPEGRLALAEAWYTHAAEQGDRPGLAKVIDLLGDDPKAHPDPAKAAMLLAASHEASGNPQAALRYYALAIELAPNEPAMRNNYAYLLVNTGGSAEVALSHAERGVQLAVAANLPPAFLASFYDTLGVVHLRLERFEAAKQAFNEALRLEPRDIGLLIGFAEAQARGGDGSSASETLRRIDAMLADGSELGPQLRDRLETVRGLLRGSASTPN